MESNPNNPQSSAQKRDGLVDTRIPSNTAGRQKRQSPSPYNYIGSNFIKRRLAKHDDTFTNSEFLDNLIFDDSINDTDDINVSNVNTTTPNTPSRFTSSRRASLTKRQNCDPVQPSVSYVTDAPQSPCLYGQSNTRNSKIILCSSHVETNSNNNNSISGGENNHNFAFSARNQPNTSSRALSGVSTPHVNQDSLLPIQNHKSAKNDPSTCAYSLEASSGPGGYPRDCAMHHMTHDTHKTDNPTKNQNKAIGNQSSNIIKNSTSNDDNNIDDSNNNNSSSDNNSSNNNNNSGSNGNSNSNSNSNEMNDINNNNNINGSNSNSGNSGNGNDNNGGNIPSVAIPPKKSSQALVQKLQDIYKIIVKQEIELQERCSQLTTSQTTELKNLWTIYKINSELINNYVTFITTALLPSQSEQDLSIGQEIVEIYRIERRLWVYGTITFLDVLKNFSNFMDPEVCCQFITHVFISISNMLADISSKYAIPWLQRLGDLSRMAIALYPSGFMDWKLSAEHWYMEAMKFTYNHGKLYYHMSTVQQNTLEAFVNLGKSVFCQDTFIPSQQYMQLVIDNIYQRAFVERNSGNHRNAQLIEYLKHSEVMLLPSFAESLDLQQVVLMYFRHKFGKDSDDNNIFSPMKMFQQNSDQLKYFFRHAPAFAESHILQLVGFGDPKNPFALLFGLPKFLKERKDKKEKRKTKAPASVGTSSSMAIDDEEPDPTLWNLSPQEFFENTESLKFENLFPSSVEIWNESLKYVNMTSLKCSMIVLQKFLHGPMIVALPHLLPWTYFIISVFKSIEKLTDQYSRQFWIEFMNRIFPWNTIVNFLNMLMAYMLDNNYTSSKIDALCHQYSQMSLDDLLNHFNNNEELPEVWKCWGTLWFDVISNKGQAEIDGYETAGIKDYQFLDTPVDGIGFEDNDETGANFWKRSCRVIFLFKEFAQRFDSRLSLSFTAPPFCRRGPLQCDNVLTSFSFKLNKETGFTSSDGLLSPLRNAVASFEDGSPVNTDYNATPMLSVIENESIFEYPGYKKLFPTFDSYDKSGEFISGSFYTSNCCGPVIDSNKGNSAPSINENEHSFKPSKEIPVLDEEHLFNECMDPTSSDSYLSEKFQIINCSCKMTYDDTYFVLDATSWLRHFAHVYKLATKQTLKFAICLTTFQELRFLRKSKDENVVEAATRAIITVRQLYNEERILPLRFTGNVATHIEEHLEFEEKITWRSHVDEFVFEAVLKAQDKFRDLKLSEGHTVEELENFKHVLLVTDDGGMRKKALDHGITTFSTRFVFSICSAISQRIKSN